MQRVRTAPGVGLDVIVEGNPSAPTVVLLHGFPESSHSWRHQVGPLVQAGYRVVAPDQRGYAGSSAPSAIDAYAARHLTADIVAILDHLGVDRADVVGHDWGSLVAWHMGYFHPARCRSITGVSVPFNTWPAPPTELFAMLHGDRFFYINHFQQPGVAEAEIERDPERFLTAIWWAAVDRGTGESLASELPAEGTTTIEAFEHAGGGRRDRAPDWLGDIDVATYVDAFARHGFAGPINWYRNFDTNFHDTRSLGLDRLSMPTAFIAGAGDPVIADRGVVDRQGDLLPNFQGSTLIGGAGHWVQQEAPERFTAALLSVLDR